MFKQVSWKSNKKRLQSVISLFTFVVTSTISLNTIAASATSSIGITKLPSLVVRSMDDAELYRKSSGDHLSTTTCLQAQGDSVSYRISASSLNNATSFSIGNSKSGAQIPYSILWSDRKEQHTLSHKNDISDVIQANANVGCEMKTLSVKFNDEIYSSVENGVYIDTLSVILVIE